MQRFAYKYYTETRTSTLIRCSDSTNTKFFVSHPWLIRFYILKFLTKVCVSHIDLSPAANEPWSLFLPLALPRSPRRVGQVSFVTPLNVVQFHAVCLSHGLPSLLRFVTGCLQVTLQIFNIITVSSFPHTLFETWISSLDRYVHDLSTIPSVACQCWKYLQWVSVWVHNRPSISDHYARGERLLAVCFVELQLNSPFSSLSFSLSVTWTRSLHSFAQVP